MRLWRSKSCYLAMPPLLLRTFLTNNLEVLLCKFATENVEFNSLKNVLIIITNNATQWSVFNALWSHWLRSITYTSDKKYWSRLPSKLSNGKFESWFHFFVIKCHLLLSSHFAVFPHLSFISTINTNGVKKVDICEVGYSITEFGNYYFF